MFKGYGWLTENGKSWEDYWATFRKYRHALYVTNVSKERPQGFTQLNYQFLTTLSMTGEMCIRDRRWMISFLLASLSTADTTVRYFCTVASWMGLP